MNDITAQQIVTLDKLRSETVIIRQRTNILLPKAKGESSVETTGHLKLNNDIAAKMPMIAIDTIGGNCPVQAEGRVDSVPFYFRARGSHWSMSIGDDPLDGGAWRYERYYGEWPNAGYMDPVEATAYMIVAAQSWRDGYPSSSDPRDFEAEMADIAAKSDAAVKRMRENGTSKNESGAK